jgi:hypothetical protein
MEGRVSRTVLAAQLVFAGFVAVAVALQAHGPADFKIFWAAQHTSAPYDPAAIARVLGPGLRPFSYPPTFLLLTTPLGWISQPVAYVGWVALSAMALVASLRRLAAPLVLFAPAVFLAGIIGQTSLLMGAALFAGATLLSRPMIAGVLFGLAACIKPQVVVLAPLVLIAGGHWRALAAAAATGLAISLGATALYGFHIWADWLVSLQTFVQSNDVAWQDRYLSLPGLWRIAPLAIGAVAAWRLADDPERAIGIAVAAALLGSLHAMDYDAAILAPFALSAALAGGWVAAPFVVALLLPPSIWPVLLFAAGRLAPAGWRGVSQHPAKQDASQG